jgi:hypothetical protein
MLRYLAGRICARNGIRAIDAIEGNRDNAALVGLIIGSGLPPVSSRLYRINSFKRKFCEPIHNVPKLRGSGRFVRVSSRSA